MSRLARIAGSFIVVVATWWVYSIAAVPFIEPQESHDSAAGISDEDRQRVRSAVGQQRAELGHWFAKDDWEVTSSPTILETAQGKLLFKSHTADPADARVVTLTPCTMVFLPEGTFESEAERNRRAVVLRAPAGADLRFRETFDLKHVQADNKLIGARLKGKVTIRSDQRSAGPEDDLLIVTQEVTMADDRITTPHQVDFTYGPNRGRGRDMRLDLYGAEEKAGQPTHGPVKTFELAREVYMRIEPGEADLFPGAGPQPAKAETKNNPPPNEPGAAEPKPPVEITCQGPFRFEMARYLATFKDHVDVLRLNTTGPSDQMTCEKLDLEFEPDPTAAAATGGSMPKLRPRRIIAEGTPVLLRSPSNGVEARGRKLNYDIQKRSGRLSDNDEAMLRQRLPPAAGRAGGEQREIHARELYFESDPENPSGLPKVFSATGKGWLRGSPPTDGGQTIFVRWTTALKFHPYQGSQLLSILGDAHAETPDSGNLDAEKIFVWLRPAGPGAPPGGKPRQFDPEKMLALGHVRPNSPQLEGEVGEMHVWFDPPAPPPPVAAGPALAQPAPPPPPPAKRSMPDRRFHVSGDLLQAQVVHRGEQMDVSELTIDGHTRCAERPTALTDEEPLVIVGDHLHLTQPTPENMTVQVTGQPARIDARKMTLIGGSRASGGSIFLRRATNQLWVPGPGTLLLPVDRDMQGRPLARPQPMTIEWQGRMDFDGQAADFKQKVVAHNAESQLRTPFLRAIFSEPVRFDGGASDQRPQIERLICRQGVDLEHRVLEGRRMTSWERMKARDLNYEYTSGDVAAQGPGVITRTWLDDGGASPVLPGGATPKRQSKPSGQTRGQPSGQKGKPLAKPATSLVYLNATFEERLTGNQHRELMVLHGHVRAVYGPVADWRGKLNPDHPELLGDSGFVLTCDQLDVAKNTANRQGQAAFELIGLGNTVVEGAAFLARARRLTYSSQSDRLVLEGDGWAGARLYREHRKDKHPKDLVAGKISYWPKTQRIKLDDFHSFDFSHVQSSEEDDEDTEDGESAGKVAPGLVPGVSNPNPAAIQNRAGGVGRSSAPGQPAFAAPPGVRR